MGQSATQQIDYDALAAQHGASTDASGGGIDYDSLASTHGGSTANPHADILKKYGLPESVDLTKDLTTQTDILNAGTKPGIEGAQERFKRLDAFSNAYQEANPHQPDTKGIFASIWDEAKNTVSGMFSEGTGTASMPPIPGQGAVDLARTRAQQFKENPVGATARTVTDLGMAALPFAAGEMLESGPGVIRSGWRKIGNPMGLASTGEELLTQGISPRTSMTNFKPSLERAAGDLKAYDAQSRIGSVQDLNDAIPEIKKKIWDEEIEPALKRQAAQPVNMKPVADKVRAQISDEMREFDEDNAGKLDKFADKLENARDVTRANSLLKYANGQLEAYFQKFPAARKANLMNNPETAGWEAARSELRNQFLSTLESAGETGVRDARLRYGAFDTLQDAVERRVNVADRAKPMSLGRIVGLAAAVPTGGLSVVAGELSNYLNKPDVLVRRGINNLQSMPGRSELPPPITMERNLAPAAGFTSLSTALGGRQEQGNQ